MNNKSSVAEAQGAEASEEIHIGRISEWLVKDLDAMLSLLSAIREDVELRNYMCTWFYGRIQNAKHKEELKNGK